MDEVLKGTEIEGKKLETRRRKITIKRKRNKRGLLDHLL